MKLLEGVIESSLDVLGLVRVVPELRGNEELFTLDARVLDSLTDFDLAKVERRTSVFRQEGGKGKLRGELTWFW